MAEKREKFHDIFMSYSQGDERQVKQLVDRLEERGLKVWFSSNNITFGDQIPPNIDEALQESWVLIVALSPSSVKSTWVITEWSTRLMQMSRDKRFKLIPLQLMECEIPTLLQSFRRFDFRNVDFSNPLTFENKLQELVNCIRESLPDRNEVISLPIAIIAMNRPEMEELISGSIFNQTQRQLFDRFIKTLKPLWPQGFVNRYTEFREDWRPFLDDNKTVREFINSMIDLFNKDFLFNSKFTIQPEYLSNDFLSSDNYIQKKTWRYFDQTGCILVLDAVSMFHPSIDERFMKSLLGASNHISVVGIYPMSPYSIEANREAEEKLKERLVRIFERFEDDFAPECTFEIGDKRALNRWLHANLPQTIEIIQKRRPSPEMKKKMQGRVESKPGNIGSIIFGTGI